MIPHSSGSSAGLKSGTRHFARTTRPDDEKRRACHRRSIGPLPGHISAYVPPVFERLAFPRENGNAAGILDALFRTADDDAAAA
jgi:hypothetical protein